MYAVVNKEEEQHSLENDINNLVHWSDKWLLKFNKSKCKQVHLGHATNTKYKMGENEMDNMKQPAAILVLPVLYTILVLPVFYQNLPVSAILLQILVNTSIPVSSRIFQYLQY